MRSHMQPVEREGEKHARDREEHREFDYIRHFPFLFGLLSRRASISSRHLLRTLYRRIFRGRGRQQNQSRYYPDGRNSGRQRTVLEWALSAAQPALTNNLCCCCCSTRGGRSFTGWDQNDSMRCLTLSAPNASSSMATQRAGMCLGHVRACGTMPGRSRKIRVRPVRGRHPDQPVEERHSRQLCPTRLRHREQLMAAATVDGGARSHSGVFFGRQP